MSLIIKDMKLPQHAAVNGEKDTAYKCLILAHPDNSVELVIDTAFASQYGNGHNIQRYPLTEIPTPHGRLIDADRAAVAILMMNNHPCGHSIENISDVVDWLKIKDNNIAFPTIIEAEVSE